MKTKLQILLVSMMLTGLNAGAQTWKDKIRAVKLEFDGSSMIIGLSQYPKIMMEDGCLVIKTITRSIALSLPCRATFVNADGTAVEDVAIYNNNEIMPLHVYSLGGKKVATLKDKNERITLRRGIYIINGKKMIIK